jgi:tight adherence protein C
VTLTRAVLGAMLAGGAAAGALVELAAARAEAAAEPRHGTRRARDRLLALLARLGRAAGAPLPPTDLESRIAAAGAPRGLGAGDLMAVKGGGALVAVLATVPLVTLIPGRLGLMLVLGAPAFAFLAPDLWLVRRTRARAHAMAIELADVLDLLRVAIEAGLTTARALGEVGTRHSGLVARELRVVAGEIALGVPFAVALRGLVARCPVEGIATLVAALERAERHGAPLGRALAAQAAEARSQRTRRMVEEAARAAPKMQLAVALLLVPSVLCLVAAALVTTLTG